MGEGIDRRSTRESTRSRRPAARLDYTEYPIALRVLQVLNTVDAAKTYVFSKETSVSSAGDVEDLRVMEVLERVVSQGACASAARTIRISPSLATNQTFLDCFEGGHATRMTVFQTRATVSSGELAGLSRCEARWLLQGSDPAD